MRKPNQLPTRPSTWDLSKPLRNAADVVDILRQAGLPLANGVSTEENNGNESSKTVCIIAISQAQQIHALIATPSGLAYQLAPTFFEKDFWSFACKHYYLVTGNQADRQLLENLCDLPEKTVGGKALGRMKSNEPSQASLDDLLHHLGFSR